MRYFTVVGGEMGLSRSGGAGRKSRSEHRKIRYVLHFDAFYLFILSKYLSAQFQGINVILHCY